jgi:hypothetical protein
MGSSADQSIFNKIEQPQFINMLSEKAKATLHIEWYAVAGDPKAKMKAPDWRFHAGSYDGVYATGDRAAMVALAESENKRRDELYKDKGIDEGPGGSGAVSEVVKSEAALSMSGEGHHLTGTLDGTKLDITMASVPRPFGEKLTSAINTYRDLANSLPAGAERTKAEATHRDLAGIETWYEAERTKILAETDKAKRAAGMPALIHAMKDKIISVGQAHGLRDLIHESFGIDKLLATIAGQVRELRKYFGQSGMVGDGHNNTAAAAEALNMTTNHGAPLRYTERHGTRAVDCRAKLLAVIQQMDALDVSHPTLGLSTLAEYHTAKTEMADCDKAITDPAGYLAAKGFRVVNGDFQ